MNHNLKIILAGTGNFAAPSFEKIINEFDVVAIITQPDREAGRGYKIKENPVKNLALKYDLKLFQPEKIGTIYDELKELSFDVFLTASYGQYIPTKILDLPKLAALNIHGSLLPKYRGAAPIQHALWNGDKVVGINLIYMTKVMDAGNILVQAKIDVDVLDDSDSLFIKLSNLASQHISDWLIDFQKGKLNEIIQDENLVSQAPKLNKDDAYLDLENITSDEAINKIKAFSSNPGAWTKINDKRVKIFMAIDTNNQALILNLKDPKLVKVKTKDNFIYLLRYAFEGKKKIEVI